MGVRETLWKEGKGQGTGEASEPVLRTPGFKEA